VVADDHASVAEQMRILLSVDSDVVAVVHSGQDLIDVVAALTPDLIVTDLAMPHMSGLSASRIIRQHDAEARIVFVSVRGDSAVIRQALSLGAMGYVVKSDAGEELAEAVQAVLGGGRYLSTSARSALGQGWDNG
jgi:DNA-binding NarL/FixJ family response regulator